MGLTFLAIFSLTFFRCRVSTLLRQRQSSSSSASPISTRKAVWWPLERVQGVEDFYRGRIDEHGGR